MKNSKTIIKSLFCAFLSTVLIAQPTLANNRFLEKYSANNIMFYDQDACKEDTIYAGNGNMEGSNNVEKIISFFMGNNTQHLSVKKEAIAGILASVHGESGFNPFRNQYDKHVSADDSSAGHAYGIFQFDPRTNITTVLRSDPRTKDIFDDYYKAENSYSIIDNGYNMKEDVPVAANDAFLEVELEYGITHEFQSTTLRYYRHMGGEMGLDYLSDDLTIMEALQQAENEKDAAKIFVWIFERPADKPGGAYDRGNWATDIYLPMVEEFVGSASTNKSSESTKSDGSDVTIIGDSITVRSQNDILELIGKADITAQVSKAFTGSSDNADNPHGKQILTQLVNDKKLRKKLVFALGTNSPNITKEQVQEIVDLAGKNTTIIFLTNYATDDSIDYTANNNVFQEIKNTNTNVIIGDWSAAISTHTDWMDDNVHPKIGDGTKLFAQTIVNSLGTVSKAEFISSQCCDKGSHQTSSTTEGVTKATIDGTEYAFPLAGASHDTYLNPGGQVESVLSRIPCNSTVKGACHHHYYAVDMGVNMQALTGKKPTSSDYSSYGAGTFDDYYYASSGATVVAVTSGTIDYAQPYTNEVNSDWHDDCGQIGLSGDDGNFYWLGHLDYHGITVKAGDKVSAGDKIATVGAPQCAQNTQAHLHIDISNGSNNKKPDEFIVTLMDELWESLPDSGNKAFNDSKTCPSGNTSTILPQNGMTLEEAEKMADEYNNLPDPHVEDPWGISANDYPFHYNAKGELEGCGILQNCSEFSLYFVNRYTNTPFGGFPDGGDVVGKLLSSGLGFEDGGHTPKAYAVFSRDDGPKESGHTGVIVGVDESRDVVVVVEAGCPGEYAHASEKSLSTFSQEKYTYAYTDNILK